LQGYYYTYWNS